MYVNFHYYFVGNIPGGLNNPNLKDAEYKLAQSGDATCNGLDSAEVSFLHKFKLIK